MKNRIFTTAALLLLFAVAIQTLGFAQPDSATQAVTGALPADEGEQGMTLFNLLQTGGWVMAVLAALSVMMLTMVFYYFTIFTESRLLPSDFVTQLRNFARDQKLEEISRLCRRSKNVLAKVVLAGVNRAPSDPAAVTAAMEAVGKREAQGLMRKVRYLSDIATVAPMLGLLGTVLGMIKAFNLIAFDISAVKPVALASAVAQALVTTAAGLIVAIPSMGFYFFFRSKLESIVGRIEEVASETADQIAHPPKSTARKTVRKTTSTRAKKTSA